MISRRLLLLLPINYVSKRLYAKSRIINTSQLVFSRRTLLPASSTNLLKIHNSSSTMSDMIVTYDDVNKLKEDCGVYIIDVREPQELQESGEIPNSINIPLGKVEQTLKNESDESFKSEYHRCKPDSGALIIFSCKSGKRAAAATDIAIKLGFNNVKTYAGSWIDWEKHTK